MTSGNSSLRKAGNTGASRSSFIVVQKQILGRRLWLAALISLYCLLYYPVAVALLIQRSDLRASGRMLTKAAADIQRLYEVDSWLGVRGMFAIFIVMMGVLTGIQGFSYLFHAEKLDFYESQPMSRKERFWQIYVNGILLYCVPMLVMCALAVLIAACAKAMQPAILLDTIYAALRNILIYYSSYNISVLAVMLSGNAIISGIVAGILMLAQSVVDGVVSSYESFFYCTSYDYEILSIPSLSPLVNWLYTLIRQGEITAGTYLPVTMETLRELLKCSAAMEIINLAVGSAALLAAWLLYRHRRAEHAGQSVLHAPVRFVLKALVAVCSALLAGMMMIWIINIRRPLSAEHISVILAILFVCVLACGVIECVYQQNIRRFFTAGIQTVLISLFAVAFYFFCALDISGYDRYVPAEDLIESAALYQFGNDYFFASGREPLRRINMVDHVFGHMALTDTQAIVQVAEAGMETRRNNASLNTDDENVVECWDCCILYRLKNGRIVTRSISIPYSIDPSMMDRLIGSAQYREASFPVYDDEYLREMTARGAQTESGSQEDAAYDTAVFESGYFGSGSFRPVMGFTNGIRTVYADGSLYSAFSDAYRRDLEKYTFTLSNTQLPLGMVTFENNYYGPYVNESFAVYPSYTETIRFLKENGLYLVDFRKEDLPSLRVVRYEDYGPVEKQFSQQEEIRSILEHSCPINIEGEWMNKNREWGLDIIPDGGDPYLMELQFFKDKVPAFVLSAF